MLCFFLKTAGFMTALPSLPLRNALYRRYSSFAERISTLHMCHRGLKGDISSPVRSHYTSYLLRFKHCTLKTNTSFVGLAAFNSPELYGFFSRCRSRTKRRQFEYAVFLPAAASVQIASILNIAYIKRNFNQNPPVFKGAPLTEVSGSTEYMTIFS